MSERRTIFWLCAILVATVAALYAHALQCDFIDFDDKSHVTQNPCVVTGLCWPSIRWAFSHFVAAQYIPLTWVSHMVDVSLFGLDPHWHHLGNVVLHAVNACLVLLALRALTGRLWPSAVVAALFAVHPINVESVAWIAERKNVLSTTFWLLAMWAYARHAKAAHGRWMWWVAACMLLGLLAKPMLVTLPFALLLLDVWPLRRHEAVSWWRLVWEKTPLWALTIAASASTLAAAAHQKALIAGADLSIDYRLANAVLGYAKYLGHLFWPTDLAVLYPLTQTYSPVSVALSLALLLAITAGCWMLRKTQPFLLIGWLWFLGILVPVSSIFQVGMQASADRFSYIPQLGIFWGVVWLAAASSRSVLRVAVPVMGAAMIALSACTIRQLHYWTDTVTLFEYTLTVAPANGVTHAIAGMGYARLGEDAQAVAHFRAAQTFLPTNAEVCSRLGEVLVRVGEMDEAVRQLRAAVKLEPQDGTARYNLVAALVKEGRMEEASQYLPK